jgi:acetyl/propionyl-CoA carboxylase alpha subunit
VELIARLGERIERVSIERVPGGASGSAGEGAGDRYRIRVGDRWHEVNARALGPFVQSLVVDGESHETAVFRAGEGVWSVGWGGRTTRVELVDPLTHLAEEARGGAGRTGRQTVTAYMPGRVVSVAVELGAAVEPGMPLVVLEAMKMQNEIQAERAGTVRQIHVAPGQAVEGGDPLLELE